MRVTGYFFNNTTRRGTRRAAVLSLGLAAAGMGVLSSPVFADQSGCTARSTTVGVGYPNSASEQKGSATNTGCTGNGKLEVKLMEHKTWAPDDEVSSANWTFTAGGGTYTRTVYGCDPDDGEFYAEQNLWGNGKKQSNNRAMKNCELK